MSKRSVFATVCAVALLGGTMVYYNVFDEAPVSGVAIGNRCPDFTAQVFELQEDGVSFAAKGETFTLSEQIGKVCVVNFWGTTCQACVEELPEFNEIEEKYGDAVEIIALAGAYESDTVELVEGWLTTKGWHTYDPVSDWAEFSITFGRVSMETTRLLGVSGFLPRTVVVDKSGIVVYENSDRLSFEDLDEIISKTL